MTRNVRSSLLHVKYGAVYLDEQEGRDGERLYYLGMSSYDDATLRVTLDELTKIRDLITAFLGKEGP